MSRYTVASVRVPATTANLGPGFDTLGIALNLYNTVSVARAAAPGREEAKAASMAGDQARAEAAKAESRAGTKRSAARLRSQATTKSPSRPAEECQATGTGHIDVPSPAACGKLPAGAGAELSGAMVRATADAFFRFAGAEPFPFHAAIKGNVPRSRGLGSSVTVRLGLAAGLNLLAGEPLDRDGLLDLTTELEGHPDNAAPAVCGGFAACAGEAIVSMPVKPRLRFVVLIPDLVLETRDARRVLPARVPMADAVLNIQNTAVITAAFCCEQYEILRGLFRDKLHEPYRSVLIPGFYDIIAAAEEAGALGAFLSGAGSSIMALVLEDGAVSSEPGTGLATSHAVAEAMQQAAARHGLKSEPMLLKADNSGVRVTGK
ncbi:hypothetical protein DB346_18215 [Verrucomicrobia bacterium LW23]|nr:hypothetical protein DB346_18215 [Verrucomicrobia bacterium LW23]